MKLLTSIDAACELASALGRPVLYLGLPPLDVDWPEVQKAAPYLSKDDIFREPQLIVCDDEAELWRLYGQTVGDDGPTEMNPYSGPATVYALAIDAKGKQLTENT